MAIQINWLVEGSVCLMHVPASVNMTDVRAYDADLMARLNAASHKLHLIVDVRSLKSLPPVPQLVRLQHPGHPNLGHNLTIGLSNNPVVRFVITMGAQLVGIQHKDFKTLEEARQFLYEMEGV
jgi:hypothetical protein